MFELVIAIAGCVAMGKIADADGRSALRWGLITAGFCFVAFAIPWPFLRIILACFLAFVAMMVAKARAGR